MKRPLWMRAPEKGGDGGTAVLDAPEDGGLAGDFEAAMSGNGIVPEPKEKEANPAPPEEKPAAAKERTKLPEKKKVEVKAFDGIPEGVFADPAKPAEKPAEPVEKAHEELDTATMQKGMSDSGRKNFQRLQDHLGGQIQTLKKELEEARAATQGTVKAEEVKVLKEERDRLAKEHAEMAKTIELIATERSPQFQAKFVRAREEAIASAMKKVKGIGGDPEKFRRALELDGRARYDAIEESMGDNPPNFIYTQVTGLVSQIEDLDQQRAEALANSTQVREQWATEQTARQREDNERLVKAREQRFDELLPELSKEVLMLRRIEGNDDWNKIVDGIKSGARDFLFNGNDFDSFVAASAKAQAYDRLQTIFLATRDRNLDLERQLAELTAADPGTGTGGGGGGGREPEEKEDLSLGDAFHRAMQQSAA